MSAYNQLMAEEEEAAAKAAAKKAKKQKQKAKKQQAQQAESSADAQALAASDTQSLPSDSAPELKLESSEGLHKHDVPALGDVGAEPQGSDIVTPPQSPDMRPVHVTAALTPHSGDDRQSGGDQVAPHMPATGVVTTLHPAHDRQAGGDQMVPTGGPRDYENFLQNLLCCPITKVCTTSAVCDVCQLLTALVGRAAQLTVEQDLHHVSTWMSIQSHVLLLQTTSMHICLLQECIPFDASWSLFFFFCHTSTPVALALLSLMDFCICPGLGRLAAQ